MRMRGGAALAALALVAVSGCAIRLGGPKPETYDVATVVAQGEDATALGSRLRSAGTDLLLLAADQDSAWFARVGEALGLTLSGPGRTGGMGLALYSDVKILGDTALVLTVESGGRLHMQDALYEIEEGRHIDMMFVQVDGAETRDAVRTLLNYYATDVGNAAAVLLAVRAPTAAAADSVALLLRSAFGNVVGCEDEAAAVTGGTGALRLFYGPQARIDCERGAVLAGASPGIAARVTVGR